MNEVLSMPGRKRMTITMLRNIDSAERGKRFARGIGGQHGPRGLSPG